jgi:N-acetylneuraminate synthase/sialic acid synthase
MDRRLEIDGVRVDDFSDAYVIAEIGHNHQGSLQTAKELFRQAKASGANAVKLQKRDNRNLYIEEMYNKPYDHENSFGLTYGEHREALEFGHKEYVELQRFAREIGITFFSTAFDFPSVEFLEKLDAPAYKVASGDLRNIPLIKRIASVGKPIIISTGGATMEDVRRAHDAIVPINRRLCIMQCTSSYPAEYAELNLRVIESYRREFPGAVIGYSGHDNGIAMAVAAYLLGARVIEKHFTLNRSMKGTDHAFSLEPIGMKKMVRDLQRVKVALGDGVKRVYPSERGAIAKMGKKIVAARDLALGHVISETDLAFKSPGDGVPPYECERVVGKTLRKPLKVDEAITFDILEAVGSDEVGQA